MSYIILLTFSFLIPLLNAKPSFDSIDIFGRCAFIKLNDGFDSVPPKPVKRKVDSFELLCSVAKRFVWTDPSGCLFVSSAALAAS